MLGESNEYRGGGDSQYPAQKYKDQRGSTRGSVQAGVSIPAQYTLELTFARLYIRMFEGSNMPVMRCMHIVRILIRALDKQITKYII